MSRDLRTLTDQQLSFALRQLEFRLASLRHTQTAVGIALLEQYRERLDAAKAEQERRCRV